MKVEEIADKYITSDEKDPFAVLLMVAAGDWKGLGFNEPHKISYTGAGIEFEEANVKLADRVSAAKEAAKYLYAQKQSIKIDLATIHNMNDEEFKKFQEEYIKAHVGSK